MKNLVLALVVLLLLALGAFLFLKPNTALSPNPKNDGFHIHAAFKLFINGQEVNFSKEEFMQNSSALRKKVHFHELNGKIIHVHAPKVTLGMFFESIGLKLDSKCITLSNGVSFCSKEGKSLKLFVNGSPNTEFNNYEIKDLDRILISYGAETDEEIQTQMSIVSSNACIYSETCPEKGSPPEEASCVGSKCFI